MTPSDAAHDPPVRVPAPLESGASVEDLAARFWDRLRLFAARRLGSVDSAEDVAQETLRRVTEAVRAGRLREPEALPGFVFQTALHICQQHARSAEREARGLVRMVAADGVPESPDALDGLVSEERRRGVHRALVRLRAEDRELLRLLYFQDLEPDVIARQLGLTQGALRVRKHRALRRLAELMEDRDD